MFFPTHHSPFPFACFSKRNSPLKLKISMKQQFQNFLYCIFRNLSKRSLVTVVFLWKKTQLHCALPWSCCSCTTCRKKQWRMQGAVATITYPKGHKSKKNKCCCWACTVCKLTTTVTNLFVPKRRKKSYSYLFPGLSFSQPNSQQRNPIPPTCPLAEGWRWVEEMDQAPGFWEKKKKTWKTCVFSWGGEGMKPFQ